MLDDVNLHSNVTARYRLSPLALHIHASCAKLTLHRIKNPLAGIPRDTLLRDVEQFAQDNDLADITDVLKRGALVAQDPPNFESVEGITEEEKDAIRNEVLHKWRQPKALYFTVILCSIGAAVQYAFLPDALRSHHMLFTVLMASQRMGPDWFKWRELVIPRCFRH